MNLTKPDYLALLVLIAGGALTGIWAQFFPGSFYSDFPGLMMGNRWTWISVDGPFNEHLIRDVGGGYLAVLVMTVFALRNASPVFLLATGLAWIIMQAPHLYYHLHHPDVYSSFLESTAAIGGVAAFLVASVWLSWRGFSTLRQ